MLLWDSTEHIQNNDESIHGNTVDGPIWKGRISRSGNPDGLRRGEIRDIRTGPGAKIGGKGTSRGLPIGIGGRHLKDRPLLVPDVSR